MYQICLNFFISHLHEIVNNTKATKFDFIQNQSLVLQSQYGGQSNYLKVSVNEFQTELDAKKSLELLETSLLSLGLLWDLGVIIQSSTINSSGFMELPPSLEENVTGITSRSMSEFGRKLTTTCKSSINVSDKKLKLALKLYNVSRHEVSKTSEFLILVMAMESLLKQEERSEEAVNLVNQFEAMLKESSIDNNTIESMLGSLKNLKKESIGQGLQRLADMYLPNWTYNNLSASQFIKKCYNIRSNLLHNGETKETRKDFLTLTGQLKNFVSEFLIQKLSS